MKLGFIGLGNMGGSIARDLLTSGNTVTVHDLDAETLAEFGRLGARLASSPAEVAAAAEAVGICVRSDDQVLDVVNGPTGILRAAPPGLIIAVHSTIHLETLDTICKLAEAKGVRVVDAPVSRGTNAPKTKAIVFMLGGAPEDVAKVACYVSHAALKIVQTGKRGSALTLKICNNVITYLMLLTLRDSLRLMAAAEIDLRALAELVAANGVAGPNMLFSINRRLGQNAGTHHLIDTTEVNAALGEKDLSCALDAGRALGIDMPMVSLARREIREAMFEMLR
jgi:3-hydroxyisobutyrate dehydrogenase